jgi:hypothetical protein
MTTRYELTPEDAEVLRGLRKVGCAVCVFLPHEMGDIDTEQVEDAMCEAGWRQIDWENDKGETV